MKNIKINYLFNLLNEIIVVLYPIIITPYLSRILLPSGIGIKSYTYSFLLYFYHLGFLGIDIYGQKEIARHKDDKYLRSKILYELFLLKFVTMSISIILFVCFSVITPIGKEYKMINLCWVFFLVEGLISIKWYCQGIEIFKKLSLISITTKIISIAFVFAFIRKETDLFIYIILLGIVPLTSSLLMYIFALPTLCRVEKKDICIFRHFKPTFIYFLPSIATIISTTIDRTMLKIIKGEEETGYYEQATKMIVLSLTIVSSLFPILRSRCSLLVKENEMSQYSCVLDEFLKMTLFLGCPLMVGIACVSMDFVPVFFGDKFLPVIGILMALSPLILLNGLAQFINASYIIPFDIQNKLNKYYFSMVILNILLNFLLIHYYGAIGASIASCISELFLVVCILIISRKYIMIRNVFKDIIKPVISSIIMGVVIIICSHYIFMDVTWIKLALEIIIGGFVYLIMSIILRDETISSYINIIKNKFEK